MCLCYIPQAGNKAALEKSASYPYGFGLAVAAAMPASRGPRPEGFEIRIEEFHDSTDDGALDDFLKGPPRTWWRNL